MAVSRSPDLEAPPFSTGPGVRHLLTQTLAGRAVLAALAVKLVIAAAGVAIDVLPAAVLTLDTFGSLVLVVALTTLLLQEIARLRYRMLWRVRRKLIISYFFMGFVPVVLIVAFFALGGLFLFFNFASYLLQTRMTATAYRAQATAFLTALEIGRNGIDQAGEVLARREAALGPVHPGGSMAVVPMNRSCTSDPAFHSGALVSAVSVGAWSHVAPPDDVPDWIGCDGFAGAFAYT
ncbi:MAG: hypothetical protein AB7P22_19930, partial [Vicinamibacterales bacterium]